jgi:hypothetical protein
VVHVTATRTAERGCSESFVLRNTNKYTRVRYLDTCTYVEYIRERILYALRVIHGEIPTISFPNCRDLVLRPNVASNWRASSNGVRGIQIPHRAGLPLQFRTRHVGGEGGALVSCPTDRHRVGTCRDGVCATTTLAATLSPGPVDWMKVAGRAH